mmetsp:Transcript_70398/g.139661  ORF Transcript_70398/g.139661 Transcript_70398/m.139661 type:complete len:216 (+) Transcript_70398:271-918(+)
MCSSAGSISPRQLERTTGHTRTLPPWSSSSAKAFFQRSKRDSTPVSTPSSWLPGIHGLEWSICMPSGTGSVFARSMRCTCARWSSTTNSKDAPTNSWLWKNCEALSAVQRSSSCFTRSFVLSSRGLALLLQTLHILGGNTRISIGTMSVSSRSCWSSWWASACWPSHEQMPSTRNPSVDVLDKASRVAIYLCFVMAPSFLSSSVNKSGSRFNSFS